MREGQGEKQAQSQAGFESPGHFQGPANYWKGLHDGLLLPWHQLRLIRETDRINGHNQDEVFRKGRQQLLRGGRRYLRRSFHNRGEPFLAIVNTSTKKPIKRLRACAHAYIFTNRLINLPTLVYAILCPLQLTKSEGQRSVQNWMDE